MPVNDISLIDTNVLVYALYPDSEHHVASRTLLDTANDPQSGMGVTTQIICELYSTITNPKRVSAPLSAENAMAVIETVLTLPGLRVFHTPVSVVTRVMETLRVHPLTGRGVFDIQLVATMLENSVRQIYTFNRKDFEPFSNLIDVLTP